MSKDDKILKDFTSKEYEHGWSVDFEVDQAPNGLNEDIVRLISKKKEEPNWLLEWRLDAFETFKKMKMPNWANLKIPEIDLQSISYYSAPKKKKELKSMDEVDPELIKTFEKLGISLQEQKRLSGVAVDAVIDSVSIGTTFKDKLSELGIIFCSFSEAVKEHPDLVKKYLGTVIPSKDNYFAALNSAVFSDGSFCYIPKGVRCPMELSTYFRINASNTGQFERTLIIADESSYVSYLEGCTAPMRDENQLHAAVVEIFAASNAEVKYSRPSNTTSLIAVSKLQPNDRVVKVLDAGHREFGENYVQEAAAKWPTWRENYTQVKLHMLGPLQTNKARQAIELFDCIHSLDRPKLANSIARLAQELGKCPELFIQVNTGEEVQKAGIMVKDLENFINDCRAMDLPILGLMAIPPVDEEVSLHFALLKKLADNNGLTGLSMGMSDDFEKAISFGATHVRVGSAIFGSRPK